MDSTVNIALWNANGLVQHYQELKLFITQHKLDILLITESHFTEKSYFNIPNYSLYVANHPGNRARGGAAVLVKNSLSHYELPKVELNYLQSSSIVLATNSGPVTISAIYCPPSCITPNNCFENFFNTLGNKFIAGGDYNAKHPSWGSRLATPRGRQLYKAIEDNQLASLSTAEPTYWPSDLNKIPDLLDFFITKNISHNYLTAKSCLDLSSDHSPVLLSFTSELLLKERPPSLYSKNTDWNYFKKLINEKINLKVRLKTEYDLEDAVNHINTVIQNSAWEATPRAPGNFVSPSNCPIQIKKLIAEKRKLRRIWQLTRIPSDKTNFNRAARQLKQALIKIKNDWFEEYTRGLSATEITDYSLWKATKYLKRPKQYSPPLKNIDGSWAKSSNEKASAFAKHFLTVFQPFPLDPTYNEHEIEVLNYLDSPLQLSLPITPFTPSEIKNVLLKEVGLKKSPGYDLIKGEILTKLPRKGIIFITFIFNAVLRLECFPSQWKVAQIVVVPKPGKPLHDVSSYRPISLLPILSKLFEKLFLKRMAPIIQNQNLIPDHQFGFRKQHSTIEQVHRITNVIKDTLEEKKFCSAVFLDVKQAFDKVWHSGLLFKLKKSLPHPYFKILSSYLQGRYFQIKLEDELTDLYCIQSGVPQGSVLGPILYTIYTSDLPTTLETSTATFADDTAVLASHESPIVASDNLQSYLIQLEDWLKRWRIKVNESKSSHITFTLKKETCPNVFLNNIEIPQVESVKYLGCHLDRRLTWHNHIWTKRQHLNLKMKKLYWLLGKNSKLTLNNKLLIYKVVLKPIWTYGIQLWGTSSKSNISIIQRFQSKLLRTMTEAPWFVSNKIIHEDLKIPYVTEEIIQFTEKYLLKLENHTNQLAINLLDNSLNGQRLQRPSIFDQSSRF